MAFFDPQLYEGLRKLIISAHQEPEGIRNMGKYSHIVLLST